MTTAQRISKI